MIEASAYSRSPAQPSLFRRYSQLTEPRTHNARPQISDAVNIAACTVDANVINTSSASITKLNSLSGVYNGIQLSPNGTAVVFTANDNA